ELGIVAEDGPKELLRALRRQWVEAELGVGCLAAPGVLILGAVVDQKAEPGRREALDEAVEHGLRLGVDPVKILDHQEQRLELSLAEPEPLERVEGPLAALRGLKGLPGAIIIEGNVQQREKRVEARRQRTVEREEPASHLFANLWRRVAVLDPEVSFE